MSINKIAILFIMVLVLGVALTFGEISSGDFFRICRIGTVEDIAEAIEKGGDINDRDGEGLTPLMWAAKKRLNPEAVSFLIKKNSAINAIDNNGRTALMHLVDVRFIIDDFGEEDNLKLSCLSYRPRRGEDIMMIALILVDAGIDVEARDRDGKTALDIAKEKEHLKDTKLMVEFEKIVSGEAIGLVKIFDERAHYVYSQIDVPDLPDTGLYRLGITVDESILADPNMATRKLRGLGGMVTNVNGRAWFGGGFDFRARYEIANPKRSFWFRKKPKILIKGGVSVNIVNTPSAKAAFEYLVLDACNCAMMSQAIIPWFSESNKLEGIGTVGYNAGSTIRFVRDNIGVIIRAEGAFQTQAVEIARKIDELLLKQSLYTYEQLKERSPKVTLRHKRHKVIRQKGRTPVTKPDDIFVDVSVPAGVGYAIKESEIDGAGVVFKNRKHTYYDDRREDRTKSLKVEMTVVSDELLVTRILHDLEISDGIEETNE